MFVCSSGQLLIPAPVDNQSLAAAPPCSPPPGTSTPAPCSSPACWSSTSPASPGPGFSLTSSVLLSPALIRPEGTLKMQRSRRRQHRLSSEVRCQNPPDLPSYQQRALKMCGPTFIHNAWVLFLWCRISETLQRRGGFYPGLQHKKWDWHFWEASTRHTGRRWHKFPCVPGD